MSNNSGFTMLSILIPCLPEIRSASINALYETLDRQRSPYTAAMPFGCVEIVVDNRPHFFNGGPSIGKKREALVKRATGRYCAFIDDDDIPAPNYIATLMMLCQKNADVCTFRSLYKLADYWGIVNHSLKNTENEQATPEGIIQRPPWHICAVRTEYAQRYDFQDINNAEDWLWMQQVLTHCKTEAHTKRIIYQYNHGPHSEADKITNHV